MVPALPKLNPKQLLLDIVIPVFNEEGTVTRSVRKLEQYLQNECKYNYQITVADNGSTDGTWAMLRKLERKLPKVKAIHLEQKGRGRALKQVWTESAADVVVYMDVDLSTDLSALPELIAPLVSGEAAIAIGSRLDPASNVTRGLKREVISRIYNWLVRRLLHVDFKDAQCGFKAIRKDVALQLLPAVEDTGWFFDTELLYKAEQRGWKVVEIPVTWTDDPDSRVKIISTAVADLRGINRLRLETNQAPIWDWPITVLLVSGSLLLYLILLSKNGYGNDFYAAAVQAGTESWRAFFFGSFDAGNFITVDKPPFSLWIMALSGRLFGFSSLSMLVPDALAGALSVLILTRTVRRWFSPLQALLAGLFFALTPIAVVMFRYNNPDAILTLTLVLSAYFFVRAVESGHLRWLIGVALALGCAFLTKSLAGLIVVPVYFIVYLWMGQPSRFRVRLQQLILAGGALALAAFWWPVVVSLTPSADRPFVGGSTNNSEWNLIFGYNGLGRLSGNEGRDRLGRELGLRVNEVERAASSAANAFGGGMFGGSTGITRMFNSEFGTQIAWLLPLALVLVLAGLIYRWRQERTDPIRTALVLWGGWVLIQAAVFSFAQGIIHSYYSVVLAPGIAAIVGITLPILWQHRSSVALRLIWSVVLIGSVVWVWILLDRTPTFLPWLRWTIAILGAISIIIWLGPITRLQNIALVIGVVTLLAAPIAYDWQVVTTAHSGGQPTAGPTVAGGGFAGGGRGVGFADAPGGAQFPRRFNEFRGGNPNLAGIPGGMDFARPNAGGAAGFGGQESADPKLVSYLKAHKGSATWIAAISTTSAAAPIELAADEPVMGMGGFMGSDPAPTLAQFQTFVKEGKLQYLIVSAGRGSGFQAPAGSDVAAFGGGFGGSSSDISAITTWVEAHGTKVNYGGTQTLYKISEPE